MADHAFDYDAVPTTAQAVARVKLAMHADCCPGRHAHRATQRWGTLHELLLTRDPEILSAVVAIRRRRKRERASGAA